jgi:hypothetical protein
MANRAIFRSRALLGTTLTVGFLVWLSYRSLRIAFADSLFRQNTVASVQQAIRWEPDNAYYYGWLGSLQEFAGQDPTVALLTSVKLDPWDSTSWIRLAARAEVRGDQASAERYLLKAAAIDQHFSPRWALMNFYFRQGHSERFWFWTTKALNMSYGDLTPVFDLCWRMTRDAGLIRRTIPDRRVLLAQYLAYLMATDRLQVADEVAEDLSGQATESERSELLTFCDRSIASGKAAPALAVWNAMCERKLLPYSPLRPEDGVSMTNGDFAVPFSSRGFDWHVPRVPEIELSSIPGGMTFTLSGAQPADSDLAFQYLPTLPGRRYNLHFEYRVGAASMHGIGWTFTPTQVPAASFQEITSDSNGWHDGNYPFGPLDRSLCRLALKAVRIPGHTRPEGRFSIRNVRIELAK